MPLYTYECLICEEKSERIAPIAERDEQFCDNCKMILKRGVDRPGWVWKPTAMGGS